MTYLQYSKYRPGECDWFPSIPVHWRTLALKWAITFQRGHDLPAEEREDGEVPVVSSGGISDKHSKSSASAPGIVTGRYGSIGEFYLLERDYWPLNTTLFSIDLHGNYPQYLHYMLQHLSPLFVMNAVKSAVPGVDRNDIHPIRTALPPLLEQRAIADFLDREIAGIDSLVDKQNRLVGSLMDKRQAVICQFVTRGLNPTATLAPSGVEWLGEVPAHWEVCRIASLFREASDVGEDGLPILTVSIHDGVSDRQLEDDELERKFLRIDDSSKYKKVIPSDLVYNMMRAWQGGFGAVVVPGLVSPAYVVARPRRPMVTKFIELLLRTPAAIEEMRCHSHGVADFRLRLYWDHFKTLRVALPPLAEQRKIVEAAQRETESIDALIKVIEVQNEKLAEYRSALISAAVTGQIDVRTYLPQEAAALCQ